MHKWQGRPLKSSRIMRYAVSIKNALAEHGSHLDPMHFQTYALLFNISTVFQRNGLNMGGGCGWSERLAYRLAERVLQRTGWEQNGERTGTVRFRTGEVKFFGAIFRLGFRGP